MKPLDGKPTKKLPGANALVGVDGNAYAIMWEVKKILRKANASEEYIKQYMADATSGDYDHLVATSMDYLSDD
jgi:hypothetical protein